MCSGVIHEPHSAKPHLVRGGGATLHHGFLNLFYDVIAPAVAHERIDGTYDYGRRLILCRWKLCWVMSLS